MWHLGSACYKTKKNLVIIFHLDKGLISARVNIEEPQAVEPYTKLVFAMTRVQLLIIYSFIYFFILSIVLVFSTVFLKGLEHNI